MRSEKNVRVVLAVVGIAMLAYGSVRILQFPHTSKPFHLIKWLVVAEVLHDLIAVPVVTAVGWLLTRLIKGPVRGYVQGGLVVAGSVTLLALVLNHRHGHSSPGNALLEQDYVRNLLILLGVVVIGTAALYAARELRTRRIEK